MASAGSPRCRVSGCAQNVPSALSAEFLCLDHFLDQAHVRADYALERCLNGKPIDPADLEWLLANARMVLQALAEAGPVPDAERQTRVLDLLLCITNLHEYINHHSVRLADPN